MYIYILYIWKYHGFFLDWKRSANGGFSIDQTVFTSQKLSLYQLGMSQLDRYYD